MEDKQTVTFEFECIELPGRAFGDYKEVRLGIQEGKEVKHDVPGDAAEARFRFALDVTRNPRSGLPTFSGAYAQGTPESRFVYLCWGERVDGTWNGFRRAKIMLGHLGWDCIHEAVTKQQPIRARIVVTDAKGGPVSASLAAGNQIEWSC